jgi:hypothetical protein
MRSNVQGQNSKFQVPSSKFQRRLGLDGVSPHHLLERFDPVLLGRDNAGTFK